MTSVPSTAGSAKLAARSQAIVTGRSVKSATVLTSPAPTDSVSKKPVPSMAMMMARLAGPVSSRRATTSTMVSRPWLS